MGKGFWKYFLVCLVLLTPIFSFAKDGYLILEGYQREGNMGRNADIHSSTLTIKQRRTIVSVSGYNDGFWISDNRGRIVARYSRAEENKAIGLVLEPGTYYAYPNLGMRQYSGRIILKLK